MRFGGRRWCTVLIHWPGKSARAARFSGRASHSVLNPHLAGRGGPTHRCSAADNPAHCWVAAQPLGVVHVLVAGEPPEYRLPQQPNQEMAAVLAGACFRQSLATAHGQSEHVVQLAVGQQSAIGGYHGTAELKHQAAVEIEPQRLAFRFTRRVRHRRPVRSPITR